MLKDRLMTGEISEPKYQRLARPLVKKIKEAEEQTPKDAEPESEAAGREPKRPGPELPMPTENPEVEAQEGR